MRHQIIYREREDMVKTNFVGSWKRQASTNIEDRRHRNYTWDTLMSPDRISPTSRKFEKNMKTGDNYSFEAPKAKKNSKGRSGERPKVGTLGTRGRRVTYAPGKVRSMSGGGYR